MRVMILRAVCVMRYNCISVHAIMLLVPHLSASIPYTYLLGIIVCCATREFVPSYGLV